MKDRDVVDLCVRTLERMFPSVTVPKPLGHLLSRWGADPCAMMSYSYVAVGGSGEDYDIMAEEVDGRVFFAGEVGLGRSGFPLICMHGTDVLFCGCLGNKSAAPTDSHRCLSQWDQGGL